MYSILTHRSTIDESNIIIGICDCILFFVPIFFNGSLICQEFLVS